MTGYNLNYPNYSGSYGSYMPSQQAVGGQVAQSGLQNFLGYASPIASIAGIGLSAYGAYQQQKAIEEQNELAREMFEAERQRGLRAEDRALEDRSLNRNLQYGQYAQGQEDRGLRDYGSYAQRIGL